MRCADARLVCSTDALVAVMHRTCLCATRSNHLSVGHLAQLIFSVHLTLSVVVSKRYKARRHKLHRSDRMRTPTKTQSDARDLAQLAAMVLLRMTMLVPTLLDSPRASEVRVSCRGCSRQSVAFTIHVCYSTAACRVQQARFQCAHMNTQPRIASIGFNDRRFVFASQSSVFRNFNASPKHEPVVNVILSLSLSLYQPRLARSIIIICATTQSWCDSTWQSSLWQLVRSLLLLLLPPQPRHYEVSLQQVSVRSRFCMSGCGATLSDRSSTPFELLTDAAKYQPTKDAQSQLRWKCLDGSKELSWSAVNDDYCDCPDGSDEPGTSACPNSSFYCHNTGHMPAYIRSSRVDDGICDPECCDGSDESDGKIRCPNRCEKVGKEYRKKLAELDNLRRAGAKVRDKYIAEGRKQKELLHAEIAKLEIEVHVATENEARFKAELTRAETSDKALIDAKVKTPLYTKLVDYQNAIMALHVKNAALKAELQTLTLLLDDLAKGYNPNYQDMAVKGAVVAYKEWRGIASAAAAATATGEVKEEGENNVDQIAGENTKLNELLDEGDWPWAKLSTLLSDDPLDLMDRGLGGALDDKRVYASETDGGLLFRIHEYLPDGIVPYFEAMVDTLLDVLMKANVITDVKRMRPKSSVGSESEPETVSVARRAHTDAAAHLSRTTHELSSLKQKLSEFSTRYGRSAEFKALENKCFSKDMGEYTYEYCFFGRATQIPNNGGAQISLGTFTNFNPKHDKSADEDAYWLQQIYARGQKCWNGPERSAIVDLECSTENKVLDVFEAEKCIYSIKVATPAVCFPPQQQQAQQTQQDGGHQVKDEL